MLEGLTPVGITFIAVLLVSVTIGVTAAVYFSWIAPKAAQRRLRRQAEAEKAATLECTSPSVPYSPYTDNHQLSTPNMSQETSLEKSSPVFAKDDSAGFTLSPPAPVYATQNQGRFSSATNEGIWWVV